MNPPILAIFFLTTFHSSSLSWNFYNGLSGVYDSTYRTLWTFGIKVEVSNFEFHFQPSFKIGKGPEHPKILWNDFASGDMRRAYLKYSREGANPSILFMVGRDSMSVGPNGIFISGKAPGLDMIYLEIQLHNLLRFRYGTSVLEQVDSNNRYLTFHALSINPFGHWQFGAAEAIVYGGFGVAPIGYFLNPFTFYYPYQEIWPDRVYDNIVWDFWIGWSDSHGSIFAEAFIDDWPYEVEENEHPVWAWAISGTLNDWPFNSVSFGFKYHGATKWTYTHKRGFTGFTRFGYPIGDSLGPDFDRFVLKGMKKTCNFKLKFMAALTRKGEATIEDYIKPHPWPDEFFLTGVVEKRWEVGFGISDLELPFHGLSLNGEMHLMYIKNFRHKMDKTKFLPIINISLLYSAN